MHFISLLSVTFLKCVHILVGSGAGGSTVAGRLAESKFSVLLLESGGFPREGYDVPAFAPRFLSDSGVTFHYKNVPQKHAALLNNGVSRKG